MNLRLIVLAVVAATINVLCEMVRRDPTDYLSLAPQLFRLMTTSSNNWMLIKLIKLVSNCEIGQTLYVNGAIVWPPFPTRASPREKTPASDHGTHIHNTRYLPSV
jgi:hypothetical protein